MSPSILVAVDLDARAAHVLLVAQEVEERTRAAADVEHARAVGHERHDGFKGAALLWEDRTRRVAEETAHQLAELLRVREEAIVADLDVEVRVGDVLPLAQHA